MAPTSKLKRRRKNTPAITTPLSKRGKIKLVRHIAAEDTSLASFAAGVKTKQGHNNFHSTAAAGVADLEKSNDGKQSSFNDTDYYADESAQNSSGHSNIRSGASPLALNGKEASGMDNMISIDSPYQDVHSFPPPPPLLSKIIGLDKNFMKNKSQNFTKEIDSYIQQQHRNSVLDERNEHQPNQLLQQPCNLYHPMFGKLFLKENKEYNKAIIRNTNVAQTSTNQSSTNRLSQTPRNHSTILSFPPIQSTNYNKQEKKCRIRKENSKTKNTYRLKGNYKGDGCTAIPLDSLSLIPLNKITNTPPSPSSSQSLPIISTGEEQRSRIKGKLKITSEFGATIRKDYELDIPHKVVLGKLAKGEIREYVDSKWLQPSSHHQEEEEIIHELIPVKRYKVRLLPMDRYNSSSSSVNETVMFGWISDRNRLKDDAYIIAKTV